MSGADHSHLSVPEVGDGIKVAQVDSPAHIAEVALVPLELSLIHISEPTRPY